MKYWKSFSVDNCTLSCDKLKIVGYYRGAIKKFIDNCLFTDCYGCMSLFKKNGYNTYRDMFSLSVGDVVVVFGMSFVGFDGKQTRKIFIEFNPNKVFDVLLLRDFVNVFLSFLEKKEVRKIDVALDIPIERECLWLSRDFGRNYAYFHSDIGITEYLGVRSHNGHVKLYDKQKESGLSYPLTRFEVTFDSLENVYSINEYLKSLHCLALSVPYFDYNKTDFCLLLGMYQAEVPSSYWSHLSRSKKEKLFDGVSIVSYHIDNSVLKNLILCVNNLVLGGFENGR